MVEQRLIRGEGEAGVRSLRQESIEVDLVVVGGGMAGVCCAITAAREGLRTVLVQDRPVLGGNASSEVRLWVLGATAHMGANNRWAREGGVVGELMVENLYRNREGNPVFWDALLLEWCEREPLLRLLLNTAVDGCEKSDAETIASCTAFNAQNQTRYHLRAPYFCDASGDGVLAFAAGAAFRMGAEGREEFDEPFAPQGEFGFLLGHTIYFYSKDVGRPVSYHPPAFAMRDPARIPRIGRVGVDTHGCHLWWFEWGGRKDTIHDSEEIKHELWRVCYGVWDHIKNSGKFPEAANKTLEWVGLIPGKRESRRFEGPHILSQRDVTERRRFPDAVAHGGWSIDLHPADGVYGEAEGSSHLNLAGVYTIPLRSYYSRTLRNCFLAGRIISASHVAFGTIRVMATGAVGGQAVAVAAARCLACARAPRELEDDDIAAIQQRLLRHGQWIPGTRLLEEHDLARRAQLSASSTYTLQDIPADGPWRSLEQSRAQMIPVIAGALPAIGLTLRADQPTTAVIRVCVSSRADEFGPDVELARREVSLACGEHELAPIDFGVVVDQARYCFVCIEQNQALAVRCSQWRVSGLLALRRSHACMQQDRFAAPNVCYWTPERRPAGHNFALRLAEPSSAFAVGNLTNGLARPSAGSNAWVAALEDAEPSVGLRWETPQTIARIELALDADFDHAMESAQFNHPEHVVPYVVEALRIEDERGTVIASIRDNHHADLQIILAEPIVTTSLRVVVERVAGRAPAALFAIRVYGA